MGRITMPSEYFSYSKVFEGDEALVENNNDKSYRNSKGAQPQQELLTSMKEIHPNFYSLIYEHYPDAIFTLDIDGNLISTNDRVEDLIGYKGNELKGSFYHVIEAEYLEQAINYFQLALKGQQHSFNCKLLHKNNQTVHVNITDIPLDLNGEVIGVFGFVRNLTEVDQKEKELTAITKSLNMAQEVAKIGSWDYDVETNYVYCSDSLIKILGINVKEGFIPVYENLLEMIHHNDKEAFDHQFQMAKRTGASMDIQYRICKPDRTFITVHVRAEAKKNENGKVIRIVGILYDISDRKSTETKLRESEEKFEKIAKNLDVGIWSIDMETNQVVYVSPPFERLTGYNIKDFLTGKRKWFDLIHKEDRVSYINHQKKLSQGEIIHHQYRIIHAAGEIRWIEDKTFPILHARGKLIRLDGIIQDISERKQQEEKIKYIAYHDYLTELPNRRMFEVTLDKLIAKCLKEKDQFALFYLDLDRFKFVNDTLGHDIGDALLVEVSNRLTTYLKGKTVFRMGGDEFTIIQEKFPLEDPVALGKGLIKEIERPFIIEGYDIHISTSIGISIFPDDGVTIKDLLMNSDAALYRAKDLGKNNVQMVSKSIKNKSDTDFTLDSELRKAIQREEFILHYQPRINTVTGDIVGAEALIRWNHPHRGLVSPIEFIPIAEETGLINEISEWVFGQVCKQIKEWEQNGYPIVPVSVNLSAKTIMKANLVCKIKQYLTTYEMNPKLIEIEITEDSLINNEETALPTIRQLRDMGILIAIDDFGTGYSSIGYLKKLPVDIIKIDRSFINKILENNEDSVIVQSIIMLAKGLRLKIVAEGVETMEQWEVLKSLGCHYLQGYLFSKPVPAEQFITSL